MKKFYPIQVIDLQFQVDQVTPTRLQLIEEQRAAPNNARLSVVIIKRRQNKMISDG